MGEDEEEMSLEDNFRREVETLDKEYNNDKLREILYLRLAKGSETYDKEMLQGVSESGNILKGAHLAEMILMLDDITIDRRHFKNKADMYQELYEELHEKQNESFLKRLLPF